MIDYKTKKIGNGNGEVFFVHVEATRDGAYVASRMICNNELQFFGFGRVNEAVEAFKALPGCSVVASFYGPSCKTVEVA